jgi:DNA ligase (NAD+)
VAGTRAFSIFDHVQGACPSCRCPISQEEGFVAWRCTNFECPAQAVTHIAHFGSRKALDIDGLGETVAEALVREQLCRSPLDLFDLTEDRLANLNLGTPASPRRMGEKKALKVMTALHAARTKPLQRWLFALGIRHLGESASKELARLHTTLTEVADSPLLAELLKDDRHDAKKKNELLSPHDISGDIGPVLAGSIAQFFSSHAGRDVLARLEALGIHPTSICPSTASGAGLLSGLTVVITGTLHQDRDEMKSLLEAHGAKVSGSVSSKTNYLLAGEGGGSKREKAHMLGVKIINEAELHLLLSGKSLASPAADQAS